MFDWISPMMSDGAFQWFVFIALVAIAIKIKELEDRI